jgi:NADH-quinone oxidoreductase subunit M
VSGFPWLSVVTFLPLAGAVVLLALPARSRTALRWWALAVTLATFGVAVGMLLSFHAGRAGYQMVEQASWVGILGFRYVLGVDGISVFMVVLTAFLMPLAVLASWHVERSPKTYFFAFLFLETATIGTFVALDLLLFFVFFEGLLFPMYLIVGGWGGRRRAYAAMKFFIYTMAGSAFLLLGILFLAFRADVVLGHQTLDVRQLAALPLPAATARWLFLAFLVAFAVKVPLVPVHTWLPDAYVEAPTAGTLVLSALLAKVGAYGLIRFNLSLFPEASFHFRDLVLVLAVLAILYGAVVAAVQSDAKRLIAYSSVSHLGFVVLGTFALSTQALSGSVLYMVNHALSTGALFLLVGMLAERVGTRDVRRMGGLANRMPVLMGLFLFCALASIGLPGLNNFVSEFLVILGTFITSKPYAVAAAAALVLSAIYLLWAYQRMAHGTPAIAGASEGNGASPEVHDRVPTGNGHGPGLWDVTGREYLIILPLVAAILFLGVYPKPVLARINPSARSTCAQVRDQSGYPRTQPIQSGVLGSVDAGVACDVGTFGRGSQPVPELSPSPSLVPLGQEGDGP